MGLRKAHYVVFRMRNMCKTRISCVRKSVEQIAPGYSKVRFKPRPNDRNMPTQHFATLLGVTCCVRLATVLQHVGCGWLKFGTGQIWANNTQHVAICRNTVAKTHATCCAQQCCDMLCWHVAIAVTLAQISPTKKTFARCCIAKILDFNKPSTAFLVWMKKQKWWGALKLKLKVDWLILTDKGFSSLYVSIHVGQCFCYIWWLLKGPFFASQSLLKLWVSSPSSWAEVQPGCWEEHLPVRWWHRQAVCSTPR